MIRAGTWFRDRGAPLRWWIVQAKWNLKMGTGTEPALRKAYATVAEPVPF